MTDMELRKPWDHSQNLLIIGPGGAGKSSLGRLLAPLIKYCLADLDEHFSQEFGNIGTFIKDEGYEHYKLQNSILAARIVSKSPRSTLLVASSGFLTLDNPPAALENNRKILAAWYSICLLPSRDLERAVSIIVDRQTTRAFAGNPDHEEATIRARYPIYKREGDLIVFADAPPESIARKIALRLTGNL